MATTRIMPLHIGKGRTESRAISEIIDYVANPQKTDHGRLITGYECDSRVADAEFMLAKRQYIAVTGRVRGADDVIAYHVRQSFCPGEITPEEANRLGVEFAKRFTKGKHAFIVCTHIDKAHVHNHRRGACPSWPRQISGTPPLSRTAFPGPWVCPCCPPGQRDWPLDYSAVPHG